MGEIRYVSYHGITSLINKFECEGHVVTRWRLALKGIQVS